VQVSKQHSEPEPKRKAIPPDKPVQVVLAMPVTPWARAQRPAQGPSSCVFHQPETAGVDRSPSNLPSRPSRGRLPRVPWALPDSILRRMSSTSESHTAPRSTWRRGAPAGRQRGPGRTGRAVAAGGWFWGAGGCAPKVPAQNALIEGTGIQQFPFLISNAYVTMNHGRCAGVYRPLWSQPIPAMV
jgi:hypothetical protein